MKYIMFEDFAGTAVPVIFPERIDFAELREQIPYGVVLSAGHVHLEGGAFRCHGESRSLEKSARAEDAQLIAKHFRQRD